MEGHDPEADECLEGERASHGHVSHRVGGQHPDARVQPTHDPVEHDGAVQPGNPVVVAAGAGPGVGQTYHCEQSDVEAGLAHLGELGVECLCDPGA